VCGVHTRVSKCELAGPCVEYMMYTCVVLCCIGMCRSV